MNTRQIILKKVKVHNLKEVDLTLDPNQLIVFTGVSGSGKSSLAFDTIYVEGQRRYIESLSTYARRHFGDLPKPDAELIAGISPTIAIEQKSAGRNPRSTVGTMTGIYDYLRVLYARVATPHCPISGERVAPQSAKQIIEKIELLPINTKIILLAPYLEGKKGEFKDDFAEIVRQGFTRIRLDQKIVDLSEEISIDKRVAHDIDLVIDRITVSPENHGRLSEAVTQALDRGKGVVKVFNSDTEEEILYSQHAFAKKSGMSYGPLEPYDFSFNHPLGMCPTCQGLGFIQEFDLSLIINPELSIAEDCCGVASSYKTVRFGNIYDNLARLYGFDVHTPWKNLSEKAKKIFLFGVDKKWIRMQFVHPVTKYRWIDRVNWKGVLWEAKERYNQAKSDSYRAKMQEILTEMVCTSCNGAKIKPYPAAAQLGGKRIWEITGFSVGDCLNFFEALRLPSQEKFIAEELLKEIKERLHFLMGVGLHYLTLDRTSPTLSGGEAQRVRLSSQIGSGLVGATYILDEPSIGLHPRDNRKLIHTLQALRNKGNTVIVVEHDEETIKEADYIVDVGPLAGQKGGRIVFEGDLAGLYASEESLTGAYLSGRKEIAIPKKRRTLGKDYLTIEKAAHHNLKEVTAKFPLGTFISITGVSGSGKSSLISDILYPALSNNLMGSHLSIGKHKSITGVEAVDKVIAIDQSPIGRTPRSNPATYCKIFDEIRDLFSQLPESEARGYKAGRFSFNVKEGSCPHCSGMGMIRIDMDFMEDEWLECGFCKGRRFDHNTLSILYRGKSIYDVLEMTVQEAHEFFTPLPKIKAKLESLLHVGLDYIKIGQPSPTLSGGEAQRIKLAKELSRPSTGKTFYILDEPTTGLHFHDLQKLIIALQALVDKGNTVLVVEHNMDLVKTSDWIIDLGPEGGREGGQIIAEGRPEKIATLSTPTGIALKEILNPDYSLKPMAKSKANIEAQALYVKGATQNNLKDVDAEIPRGKITLCTGPSGSGKTSFAFETVYAEGQRRYIESLSTYARQLVKQMPKPKVESIEGLSAAIAIEQKSHAGNPRSTIGTMTEAYDYLRVLFAHLGTAYSPDTGEEIKTISKADVVERLLELPHKTKVQILAPLTLQKNETFDELKNRLQSQGYLRLRLNKEYYELDQEIPYEKQRKNAIFLVIDRLLIDKENKKRLFEAVDKATSLSEGTCVADAEGEDLFFNLAFAVKSTGKSYPKITPHTFSFNTESGMCMDCFGLGIQYGTDLSSHAEILALTPIELLQILWKEKSSRAVSKLFLSFLKKEKIDHKSSLLDLPSDKLQLLLNGSKIEFEGPDGLRLTWNGINKVLAKAAKSGIGMRDILLPLLNESTCLSCSGARLNPLARNVRIGKLSIADVCRLAIDSAYDFLSAIKLSKTEHIFLSEPLKQLLHRLYFLKAIGLHYLSLERSAPSLSGGETQRIRLSRQLGTGLTGCLYVLDEPTIGLHPKDNERLNLALKELCNMGNTLLLVEHDPLTIEIADYVLDFGPHAGKHGGQISARGSLKEILNNPNSLTGAYLSGRKKIPLPEKRRSFTKSIQIRNASLHNLKNINVDIPIGVITAVTGVSGSGKSTLINDLLRPAIQKTLALRKKEEKIDIHGTSIYGIGHFDKMLVMDQNPIGHTSRADVSTYVDLLTSLRYFFASLPEAQARGLLPKHFSFNHKKGMCTTCQGLGTKTIEMQFLPAVKVTCEVCHGFRLNPLSLQVKTKGKHLGEILQMTVSEAKDWLIPIPKVVRILDTLMAVGLDYLTLSQEMATLSGGEAQRIRLSRELSKRSTGKTLYLFDEPSIGLHSEDVKKLLPIFHTLADKGNTVVVIEHNMDLISNADWIIDLGPEAGAFGGELIAFGTPEEVAKDSSSSTGKYLKEHLAFLRSKN